MSKRSDRRKSEHAMTPPIPQNVNPSVSSLQIETIEQHRSHTGPIPSPETLAGYEKTCPGSADRIIKMAEH
jgi:uncharacterized membrane protein